MSALNPTKADMLAKLRKPFAANQVNLLPKQMKRDDTDKGKCERGTRYSADGEFCGGWHARSIHLSYVGHAALTDRFLDVDPEWSWEPVAFGADGLPAFDKIGGLWIKLTICGQTRLGYGDAQGKTGNNAVKEAIGDALRNAGMRFGAALDLWHKGDLHESVPAEPEPTVDPAPYSRRMTAATTPGDLVRIGNELLGINFGAEDADRLRAEYRQRLGELNPPAALPDADMAGFEPNGDDGGDR